MLDRCRCRRLLLPIMAVAVAVAADAAVEGNVRCPYDIETASGMIPRECYANASTPSTTGCCWFVFGAYIYAAVAHANATGAAFLPPPVATACAAALSAHLISAGLVRPSLLLSNSSCSLTGDPAPLSASGGPCQYPTVSATRSAVNLSLAAGSCAAPRPPDLSSNESACVACQNDVIAATFALLNATASKEVVPCGMAATIGIWAGYSPSVPHFRPFVLCMVEILENVGGLGTSFLIPSPPPSTNPTLLSPPPRPPSSSNPSMTIKIIAGSAAGVVLASIAVAVCILRKQWCSAKETQGSESDLLEETVASPVLPTEGMYVFTAAELKQATNGYDESLLLGEGGAGKVYLGTLPSGQQVAIKRVWREKKMGELYKEVEILSRLRHRNLTTLVGYCLGGSRGNALVYEYMAGGNLSAALHRGELGWRHRLAIAGDVAEGLAYLHGFPEGPVVHRDVKPNNVLLGEGLGTAKLSDFGVSRAMPADGEATHLTTELRGTMGYIDPESFAVGHVSEATDVYSFGVLLLQLVTGLRAVVATPSGGVESIVNVAAAGGAAIVDPHLGPGWDRRTVAEVLQAGIKCVSQNKAERPRMTDVLALLRHAYVDLVARDSSSSPSITEAENTSPTSSQPSIHALSL